MFERDASVEVLEPRRLLADVRTFFPAITMERQPVRTIGPVAMSQAAAATVAAPDVVAGAAADTGGHDGALSGRTVFLGAGHGYAADGNNWRAGRPLTNGMVEDFGNQDQLRYTADHLLRAGATVVPLRPIGNQPLEVVLDNDDLGVSFSGNWSNSSSPVYYGDPGDLPYRFAQSNPSGSNTATYRPDLPEGGDWPVYTWVLDSANRAEQLYQVEHSGGISEIRVDHTKIGKGWVYLGTYHFDAGTNGSVTISSEANGGVIIADAIRFGNGRGDVDRGSGISGQTREDEASLYWIQRSVGQGTSFGQFVVSSDDESANVSAPPRFARHMNAAPYGEAVYIGYHTNAFNGNARGVLSLINTSSRGSTPNQATLAELTAREINDTFLGVDGPAGFEHSWANRGTLTLGAAYGEISGQATGNEFDATIIEIGFHDNVQDAQLLRDPTVRDATGRATTESLIRYFNQFSGTPLVFPPLPAAAVRGEPTFDGGVRLDFAQVSGNTGSSFAGYNVDSAQRVRVEVSTDGRGYVPLVTKPISGSSVTVAANELPASDGPLHFRLMLENAGGSSVPSRVVSVASVGVAAPSVLIVDAFDRVTRQQNARQTTSLNYNPPSNFGAVMFDRVRTRSVNSFDYAAVAANALPAGFNVATVQNEHVADGRVSLANYDAVIWLAGEESTANETFSSAEQSAVAAYLNNGGNLFASGSEIGWDLDALGGGVGFYQSTLGSDYVADDANSYAASGVSNTIFADINLTFDDGSQGSYDVDFPDVLDARSGGEVVLRYTTGGGAATSFTNAAGGQVVNFGFPFESITDAATRQTVMARTFAEFNLLDTTAPRLVASDFSMSGAFAITFELDEPIDPATFAAADVTVRNTTTNTILPSSNFDATVDDQTLALQWNQPGALPEGRFTATLAAGSVADAAGNALIASAVVDFGFLLADFNNDFRVDLADFGILRANFGATDRFFDAGDATGDGVVNLADFGVLRSRFGTTI
jgi:hypothetical protein